MDIKQLNYFKTIVEQGGFSAAARVLSVAQPVLSRALQGLETELGTQLMRRSKAGIELTGPGLHFYEKTKKLIDHYQELAENPFGAQQPSGQSIRYARSKYWTSWPLRAFHDAISENNLFEVESSIVCDAYQGIQLLINDSIDVLLNHDRKLDHQDIKLLFHRRFYWGVYRDEKDFPLHDLNTLSHQRCLCWADKTDLLYHQLNYELGFLSINFAGDFEYLMNQEKKGIALILPAGLQIQPENYRLISTLSHPLDLMIYVRRDRYDAEQLHHLKKGMEARW